EPGPFSAAALVTAQTGHAFLGGVAAFSGRFESASAFTVLAIDASTGALDVCQDGYVDSGEDCDAGTGYDTECCSSSCRIIASDGMSCNDGNACTIDDACMHGMCTGGGPLPCEPCGICSPSSGCNTLDLPFDCLSPTAADKAVVRLDDARNARGD